MRGEGCCNADQEACCIHDAQHVDTAGLLEHECLRRRTGSYLAICFTASTIDRVPMPK